MVKELREWQKSEFELIKIHMMSHLSDSIRRSGVPCEYSTDMYEHLHIMIMKVPYKACNKKNFAKQMTRHHQRLLAIGQKMPTSSKIDHQEREIALDKVQSMIKFVCFYKNKIVDLLPICNFTNLQF